jgi:hypothetical protein
MDFGAYGLRTDADEQIRRAFRDAFKRGGLARVQLEEGMEWFRDHGQHLGGDVARLTASFREFATNKGWADEHLKTAVAIYSDTEASGPTAVMDPSPTPEQDVKTRRRAIARVDQNIFNSHRPIRPSQSASLPKATTAKTMTPNGVGGSPVASTVLSAAAATSITDAACISVIAVAQPRQRGCRLALKQ